MRIALLTLALVGCAPMPSGNAACEQRAVAFADRTTRAEMSPYYQMAWRGKYEDEYARCLAGR